MRNPVLIRTTTIHTPAALCSYALPRFTHQQENWGEACNMHVAMGTTYCKGLK